MKSDTPIRERLAAIRRRARVELGPPVPDIDININIKKIMDDIWEEGE